MSWIYKRDTVSLLDTTVPNEWGYAEPTYTTTTDIRCNVKLSTSLQPIINDFGQEIIPKATISMDDIDACSIQVGSYIKIKAIANPIAVQSMVCHKDLAGNIMYWKLVV